MYDIVHCESCQFSTNAHQAFRINCILIFAVMPPYIDASFCSIAILVFFVVVVEEKLIYGLLVNVIAH